MYIANSRAVAKISKKKKKSDMIRENGIIQNVQLKPQKPERLR